MRRRSQYKLCAGGCPTTKQHAACDDTTCSSSWAKPRGASSRRSSSCSNREERILWGPAQHDMRRDYTTQHAHAHNANTRTDLACGTWAAGQPQAHRLRAPYCPELHRAPCRTAALNAISKAFSELSCCVGSVATVGVPSSCATSPTAHSLCSCRDSRCHLASTFLPSVVTCSSMGAPRGQAL